MIVNNTEISAGVNLNSGPTISITAELSAQASKIYEILSGFQDYSLEALNGMDLLTQIWGLIAMVLTIIFTLLFLIACLCFLMVGVILDVIIAAPIFYINLFSIIDSGLGTIIGTALGSIQSLILLFTILELVGPGNSGGSK